MRSTLALALLGASSAAALPAGVPELEDRNVDLACLVVDSVVTVLHAAASASPFCSSYLGIQTSTVSTTTTATSYITSVVTTITGTDTVTAATETLPTVTVAGVTAETVTETWTADATTTTTCLSAPDKRGLSPATKPPPVPTPDCLRPLTPKLVSLACSCLQVPTPTFTDTATVTASPTTVVTTDVAATATETPLLTPYYTPQLTSTTTVTVTPTVTVSECPSPTPDTSCDNQGVQFAYYYNIFGGNRDDSYSQFDPTAFKTIDPVATGVAGSASGISANCPSSSSTYSFYGTAENCNLFVLNYRGYLYSAQAGAFTFEVSSADDIVLVWAGADAYAGWTRGNALIGLTFTELADDYGGRVQATYAAAAGEYIPLRIMFGQGDGPFAFDLQVTAPDGSVVLSGSSSTNPFLVQQSCDGTSGPAYPAYGQET